MTQASNRVIISPWKQCRRVDANFGNKHCIELSNYLSNVTQLTVLSFSSVVAELIIDRMTKFLEASKKGEQFHCKR